MTEWEAGTPFRFVGCVEIREVLGRKAADVEQLLTCIETVPLDSIYYHTHSYFLRYEHGPTLFPSDFATWAAISVRDRVLSERLGLIDPFEFRDLEALRGQIVSTIDEHLKSLWSVPRLAHGAPFEFVSSHIIEVDLEVSANSLDEFRDRLATVDRSALFNHICEAKIRKGRRSGDFIIWIGSEEGLKMPDLANRLGGIQPLGLTLEGIRSQMLGALDGWRAEQAPVGAP